MKRHITCPKDLQSITTETRFLLPGPAGELELLLSPAPEESTEIRIALICHPHPLFGGTMHNKVVTTLSKTFQQLHMQTIRFNFRGVGKSAGHYAEGVGELEDLLAIIHWINDIAPKATLWLSGFSFGAYIAIRAATQVSCAGLVSIAPPVNHFPLDEAPNITCPWIIVQGGQDDVVPASIVLPWAENLPTKPTIIHFPDTGHFFHGKLTQLKAALIEALITLRF